MYYLANELKINSEIVSGFKVLDYSILKKHELVVTERFKSLTVYLQSLKPYIIIPSILVCDKTNVIIDGHHRFSALLELGITDMPVTYINYQNTAIVPHLNNSITKESIIEAGLNGSLLEPKSSFHHVISENGKVFPLILLSSLYSINNEFK